MGRVGGVVRPAAWVACGVVAVLSGGCQRDPITQPEAQRAPVGLPAALRDASGAASAAAPEAITVREVTTTRRDGASPIVRTERVRTLGSRVVSAAHGAAPAVSVPDVAPPSGAGQPFVPPLPTLSIPAPAAVAVCLDAPAWHRRETVGAAGDLVADADGVGAAPASEIRIEKGGVHLATVRRTWVRRSASWILVRQESATPDGRYRQVVTVDRRPADGGPAQVALPATACARRGASVVPAAHWDDPWAAGASAGGGAVRGGEVRGGAVRGGAVRTVARRSVVDAPTAALSLTPAAASLDGTCVDESAEDRCAVERAKVVQADLAVIGAATLMTAACIWPEPVQPALCTGAINIYLSAVGLLAVAQAGYEECLKKPITPCPTPTPIGTGGGETGEGSGGGGVIWRTCVYEVIYDAATDIIIEKNLLYCFI